MPIISGTLRHLDGSPWVGAELLFQLLQGSYTTGATPTQYPVDSKPATTIAGGVFSISLWDNGAGIDASYIRCTINGRDRLEFVIPAGSGDVQLVSLLNPVGAGTQGTRTITGHFEYLDKTPRAGEKVRIGMDTPSYTADAIYPSDSLEIALNSAGDLSQAVWANGGGSISAPIKFEFPTGETISVSIPAGSGAIDISTLRGLARAPATPSAPPIFPAPPMVPLSALEGLIDAHNSAAGRHAGVLQPFSAGLSQIAGLSPSSGFFIAYDGVSWAARALLAADIPNLSASKITTGTINDSQIPASIARDSEVAAAIAAITAASIGALTQAVADTLYAPIGSAGSVASVFGRTGTVIAQSGDYSAFYRTIGGSLESSALTGTIDAARLPATVATDSEVAAAIVAARDFVAAAKANPATGGVYEGHTTPIYTGELLTGREIRSAPGGILLMTVAMIYDINERIIEKLYTNARTGDQMVVTVTYSGPRISEINKVVV